MRKAHKAQRPAEEAQADVNLHLLLKLIGTSFASGLERMRVQKHLKSLQERNDLAMDTGNDGLWDFDAENNRVYFSPRWKAMLGYAEDEMNNSPDWRQLVHPDDMPRVQAAIRLSTVPVSPLQRSRSPVCAAALQGDSTSSANPATSLRPLIRPSQTDHDILSQNKDFDADA